MPIDYFLSLQNNPMHYLIRTIMIWLAVFFAAQIIPPEADILGLALAALLVLSFVDFALNLTTNRGLIDHIFNH